MIASGKPGFDLAGGLASNGYGAHSPGGYSLASGFLTEVVMTFMFLLIILGATDRPRAGRLRADRHRPRPDADPPDQHPGHQHLGEPGPQHRVRRCSSATGRSASCGCSGWRRSWARWSRAISTAGSATRRNRSRRHPAGGVLLIPPAVTGRRSWPSSSGPGCSGSLRHRCCWSACTRSSASRSRRASSATRRRSSCARTTAASCRSARSCCSRSSCRPRCATSPSPMPTAGRCWPSSGCSPTSSCPRCGTALSRSRK